MTKSKGHIGFEGNYEYYDYKGEVFRAHTSAVFDIHTGCRFGRWECSRKHFDLYRTAVYPNIH